ncbi:MAG: site-2 protease family protein [Clostridiales bacterium]|nr:site-2 protease family protein [Clostridiales bacterium]
MPEALTTILWGVLTFSILVILHEGGHYIAARAFRVKVHEFMVGLPGPAIRINTKSGTAFGVTAIPLGGYVRIAGMEPGPEDPLLARALQAAAVEGRIDASRLAGAIGVDTNRASSLLVTLADWGVLTPADDDDISYVSTISATYDDDPALLLDAARSVTYRALSTWKRLVVLSAGVLVNLVAAILVFTVVLSVWGYYTQSLTLYDVSEGSGAQAAGLQAGDTIVAIDDEPIDDWMELITVVGAAKPGETLRLDYRREGDIGETGVVLGQTPEGRPQLGIVADVEHITLSVPDAFVEGVKMTGLVFQAIGRFFNPATFAEAAEGARSVVGITVEVAEAARTGPLNYAWIVALLSLSLGVMNILPIPPLDGGRILIEVIERITGRPLGRRLAVGVSITGALLLFSLIGVLMYADVMRYFVTP